MKYRREIDGLRALAVLPVILFHAGFEVFSGGFVGVDVFFVISGYLITAIILAEIEQKNFSIVHFYERRARRILPALFILILVCIPFAWIWYLPGDMKDFSQSLVAVSVFSSNILFWRESGYFDTAAEFKPLLHTWSLAVEEQYYILFPLFLIQFLKLGKRRLVVTISFAFLLSVTIAEWAAYAKPAAAFFLLPTRAWEILTGTFTALYLSHADRKEFSKGASELFGWIGIAFILISVFVYNKSTPFPGVYALVPTIGTALIIVFAKQPTIVSRFLGNKFFVGIGLISYSAYLWHQPLLSFFRYNNSNLDNQSVLFIPVISSLVIGYLSWKYVEMPFRNRKLFSKKAIFLIGSSFTFIYISVGYIGIYYNGFEGRFDRVLTGDIGQYEFHKYIHQRYFDCEPKIIAENALKWDGYLRCKQSKRGKPDIVLLGDSHAEHLFLGLAEYIPNKNIAFYILSEKPYLNNGDFKLVFDELLSNNIPQNIILTMHFIGRVDAKGSGLYEGFSSTIKALLKVGKSITLVGDVPRFNQDPGLCVFSYMDKKSVSCTLDIEDLRRQRAAYDEILSRLAKDYAVNYVRIDDILCTNSVCSMSKDDEILYRDNSHLNILGSKLVGKILAQKFPF